MGTDERIADWVVREAALKATGAGMRAARELRELELHDGRVYWRGEYWHARRLALFPGTSACVLSSLALGAVAAEPVALAELFAP
jgi:phosphopantetheinyl transferase